MHDRILTVVKRFLKIHWSPGSPVLIGFSGGPDSVALLHILLECKKFFSLDLQVAHVDHGWRLESHVEAKQLHACVTALGLPFHLQRLKGVRHKEEAARQARYRFFHELYSRLGCQALVLGHQGDDQSETVLKRVLEGASIFAMGGMRQNSTMEGMKVWRPLLEVKKTTLQAWILQRGLRAIDDATNKDHRYLRGRMREAILPQLSAQFGKEVSENLWRLGAAAQEWSDYLDKKVCEIEAHVQEDQEKIWISLPTLTLFEPLEIKAFLKRMAEKNKIFLSHAMLQTLYHLIEQRKGARKIGSKGRWIEIEGQRLAIKKYSV